jgi:hypothetical protein
MHPFIAYFKIIGQLLTANLFPARFPTHTDLLPSHNPRRVLKQLTQILESGLSEPITEKDIFEGDQQ